jgi:hypothetical protein
VAGGWLREEPLVKGLTWVKIGLNKNYECGRNQARDYIAKF